MIIVNEISALKELILGWRKENREIIGFVPTMGYLHEGHTSLIKLAKNEASKTIVSIFVNPTQFNDPEDLKKYPVDLPRDFSLLKGVGVDAVFVPTPEMIYSKPFQSWVSLSDLPLQYEGASRPGHFNGVSTVVTILFNLVEPHLAVFGEKDFQQLRIIETMVEELKSNIKIVRGPTVRESDGLAMSSRNVRLNPEARKIAPEIYRSFRLAIESVKKGEREVGKLKSLLTTHFEKFPEIKTDYLSFVDQKDLREVKTVDMNTRIIFAGMLDKVRLLDNCAVL